VISVTDLPLINAVLNGTSATLLCSGYYFIRNKNVALHRRCMLLALVSSTLFLVSYLTYHIGFHVGSVHYQGTGWTRPVYFTILLTHTILAVVILPMVLITVTRALKGRIEKHRQIAHWTLPLWLYVSVTGVVIYWMLYH
jgi:putative membrane protein